MIDWHIRRLDATTSTNDELRREAETDAGEGLVITAERQSAGRGRQGRVWESPPGNLYCSVLLHPQNMPAAAGFYSFVAALAVHDAVRHFLPAAPVTLKWPNDVLVSGKKISGILLEVFGDALIAGIGVNIAHYPEQTVYPATSLVAEGAEGFKSDDILESLLPRLGYWHDWMQSEGFEPIRRAWLERAQKGPMIVRLSQGILQGDFGGIDEQGRLRLLLADGAERFISTGDVFFCGTEHAAGD